MIEELFGGIDVQISLKMYNKLIDFLVRGWSPLWLDGFF